MANRNIRKNNTEEKHKQEYEREQTQAQPQ
jgi:hypothetical protein